MKRFLISSTGLVAITMSGCALSSLLAATPKGAIGQAVSCPTGNKVKAERFKVLSTQQWSQDVVVLYSAFCPTANAKTPMQPVFGHKIMTRHGMTWQVSSGDSYGTENELAPSERLVEYGISYSNRQLRADSSAKESYTILYGRVLKPKVVAVEATFDNGKTIRSDSTNGVFALLSAGAATDVCELRVLGADNQILSQEDVVVQQLAQRKHATQCLPLRQL